MNQDQDESNSDIVTPAFAYFEDLVDTDLGIRSLAGEPLPSLHCVALNDRGMSAGFHSFSVTFVGPVHQALTQGTVVVEAPGHPAAFVFFTPTGVRDDQMHYEAVFNQPATDEEQR